MAVSNSGHTLPCNVGVNEHERGLQPAAAAAWVLDNMNIDEQLWWGRQSASPELFINIHVIQPDSSSSRLIHTGAKLLLHQCILSFFYSLLYCRLSYGFKISLRVKLKEKANSLKPVFWLLCHDFLESREVAKVTKIKT